ncbi:uncharacterized protein LOC127847103 isoform X2 [Dreissena polymorpha]|uniref:uncharacterized protein LOC127847103 isoform X2 n=1 Tax=Dreissena polymorpha TaxID=45954 RepID=UPI0022646716|nr:uncharacterized protein LOC127847103 isoform X2 [Dreissena polymorpha]
MFLTGENLNQSKMSTSGQMFTMVTILLTMSTHISGSPVAIDTDDDHLADQLSKLKALLQRLEDKERDPSANHVTIETAGLRMPPLKSAVSKLPDNVKEPVTHPVNDLVADVKDVIKDAVTERVRLQGVKAFLDSLSPTQLEHLKELGHLFYNKKEDGSLSIPVETEEGTFGALKDEVKYSIEKNLLTDLALAQHSGISVKDLLEDIVGRGNQKIDSR